MGLSIGPDGFDSLALGDTPLEALMLGDVELWSAGGGGDAGLVPMSWSDDTLIDNLPLGQVELLNYTVVGSGTARVRGVLNTYANSILDRTSRILVNGAVVWELTRRFNGAVPNTIDARFHVNDGDVITLTAEIATSGNETIRQVTSWSLNLVEAFPLAPASYGSTEPITLNQGTTSTPWEDWTVLVDYQAGVGSGTVTVTFEGEFPAPGTSNARAMRWYHNGVYKAPWYSVSTTGVYTITPRDFSLEAGDTLQLVAIAQTSTASRRALLWYNAEVIPHVETSTALMFNAEEIEAGESITATATVTPADAAGVVEFDVAGETSTVDVVNGEAVTTSTLTLAGEYDVTARFVPTSGWAIPSSATKKVSVLGLSPMSWEGSVPNPPTTSVEVVNYIVVGSGVANLSASATAGGWNYSSYSGLKSSATKSINVSVNGTTVGSESKSSTSTVTLNKTVEAITLNAGDVLTFSVRTGGNQFRSISAWSLELIPQ